MFKHFLSLGLALCLTAGQLLGQEYMVDVGIQKKFTPAFKLNDLTFQNSDAQGARLSLYNLESVPVAVEFYFAKGYDSSIDFSYGSSLSYIFFSARSHWLKTGLSGGRFKMGNFKRGNTVGSIREDEFHELIKPFAEWNWRFSEYVSFFVETGYRFLRSETETVTEINERYENGDPKSIKVSHSQQFYSSGFEFSIGLGVSSF